VATRCLAGWSAAAPLVTADGAAFPLPAAAVASPDGSLKQGVLDATIAAGKA